jgi:predicted metal-dependent hydrolase
MKSAFVEALEKGIELFNHHHFYEAHEAWEAGWIDELSDDRKLLQGLIQVAAGFHKLRGGTPRGSVKLFDSALAKLRPFAPSAYGVALDALIPEVEAWQRESARMVETGETAFDLKRVPRLTYARSAGAPP